MLFPVQFAEGIARGRDRRAAEQAKMRVARGLELRGFLLRDALDVAHREKPVQAVFVIDHEQFVDADVLGEKLVGARDRVLAEFAFVDRLHLGARRHRFGDFARGVARLDHVAGQQADETAIFIHDRKRAEREPLFLDQREHVADELVRRDFDRLLDQAVDVIFHAR